MSWLQAGKEEDFRADYRKIADTARGAKAELLLEQGLTEAAQGKPEAAGALRNFVQQYPESVRVSEAWVALAELAFHAAPPQLDEARQDLQRAAAAHGEHEKRLGRRDENWPDWYAQHIVSEQTGEPLPA